MGKREYEHDGVEATIQNNTLRGIHNLPWELFVYYPYGTLHWEHRSFAEAEAHLREVFEEHDRARDLFGRLTGCSEVGDPYVEGRGLAAFTV